MCGPDGECGGLADVAPVEQDGTGFGAQALAFALRAARIAAVFREHDADVQLVLLALHEPEESMHAGKRAFPFQHETLLRGGQIEPRHVQRNTLLTRRATHLGVIRAILRTRPWIDRAVVEGLALVRDDEVEIEVDGVAEALAARTCAIGIVEGKEPRLRLAIEAVAVLALVLAREAEALRWLPVIVTRNNFVNDLAGFAIADLGGIDDARRGFRGDSNAIDQHEDRLREVDLEQRLGRGKLEDAVLLIEAVEATRAQVGEPLA